MQYSVWYDDSLLAVCFWRELAEKNIVKPPRGINILAPRSRRIEILFRQTFNFASALRQYDYTSAVAGNPDTVRVRLAQHVFQNDFFGTQARLDHPQRGRFIKPFGGRFRSFRARPFHPPLVLDQLIEQAGPLLRVFRAHKAKLEV